MERVCKVCGEKIVGRSDKIYCSYNCRIYANNVKNRLYRENSRAESSRTAIEKSVKTLVMRDAIVLLKIISFTAYLCKIFSKFATHNKHTN